LLLSAAHCLLFSTVCHFLFLQCIDLCFCIMSWHGALSVDLQCFLFSFASHCSLSLFYIALLSCFVAHCFHFCCTSLSFVAAHCPLLLQRIVSTLLRIALFLCGMFLFFCSASLSLFCGRLLFCFCIASCWSLFASHPISLFLCCVMLHCSLSLFCITSHCVALSFALKLINFSLQSLVLSFLCCIALFFATHNTIFYFHVAFVFALHCSLFFDVCLSFCDALLSLFCVTSLSLSTAHHFLFASWCSLLYVLLSSFSHCSFLALVLRL